MPQDILPALIETDAWREASTRAARETAAVAWVRAGQRLTGAEHVVVLDRQGGLLHAGTSGQASAVFVEPLPDGLDVVLHHSHSGEASLSAADFTVAWNQSRRSEARAYTPDGGIFRGRSREEPPTWIRRRRTAIDGVASELRVLGRRHGSALTDLAAHLVNRELAGLGAVWYRFQLSPTLLGKQDMIGRDLPRLRAAIRSHFADRG